MNLKALTCELSYVLTHDMLKRKMKPSDEFNLFLSKGMRPWCTFSMV